MAHTFPIAPSNFQNNPAAADIYLRTREEDLIQLCKDLMKTATYVPRNKEYPPATTYMVQPGVFLCMYEPQGMFPGGIYLTTETTDENDDGMSFQYIECAYAYILAYYRRPVSN